MCFNCLSASHSIWQYPSMPLCKTYQKKYLPVHHGNSSQPSPHLTETMDAPQINRTETFTVLPTENVKVQSQNSRVRLLGARWHLYSDKLHHAPVCIIVVNQKKATSTHGRMNLTILQNSGNNFNVVCMVLENITDYEHPNTQIAATFLRKVSNYNLATAFFDKPSKKDLLLGQSVYTHQMKSRNDKERNILLTETVLGWTFSRVADTDHTVTSRKHSARYGINFLDSQSTTFNRF